jgi:hypothetical protein
MPKSNKKKNAALQIDLGISDEEDDDGDAAAFGGASAQGGKSNRKPPRDRDTGWSSADAKEPKKDDLSELKELLGSGKKDTISMFGGSVSKPKPGYSRNDNHRFSFGISRGAGDPLDLLLQAPKEPTIDEEELEFQRRMQAEMAACGLADTSVEGGSLPTAPPAEEVCHGSPLPSHQAMIWTWTTLLETSLATSMTTPSQRPRGVYDCHQRPSQRQAHLMSLCPVVRRFHRPHKPHHAWRARRWHFLAQSLRQRRCESLWWASPLSRKSPPSSAAVKQGGLLRITMTTPTGTHRYRSQPNGPWKTAEGMRMSLGHTANPILPCWRAQQYPQTLANENEA